VSAVEDGPEDLLPADEAGQERCVIWHYAGSYERPEAREEWLRAAFTRLEVAGGEALTLAAGNLVFGFDALDLEDVVELALGLSTDAAAAGGVSAVSAIGLGPLRRSETSAELPWWFGRVLDRVQALTQRLVAGEIALDPTAHERVAERYLFLRGVGSAEHAGQLLDVAHPHSRACREALQLLAPAPLAPSALASFEKLSTALATTEALRVSLRSSDPDEPLEWLARAGAERGGPPSLQLGRQAGGLQPLGALQLALRRRAAGGRSWAELGAPHRTLLDDVLAGRATERGATSAALLALLQADTRPAAAPWIVLERLHEIDPASLHVIATLLQASELKLVLCMTLPLDARVPGALLRGAEPVELRIPVPSAQDRCRIAEQVLGLPAGSGVARRVAQLSSASMRGVTEAARTLVSSGDLVHDGTGFVWRAGPRGAGVSIPVDALLSERLKGLSPEAHRVLEALCIAAPDLEAALVDRIVALDGLDAAGASAGRAQLLHEGWIDARGSLGAAASRVVSTVRSDMQPARAAELHRFASLVMGEHLTQGFGLGLVAHHHAEGGQTSEAAQALLAAARAAGECGFDKSAVRLAASALQLDGSAENRELAGQLARTYHSSPPAALQPSATPTATTAGGAAEAGGAGEAPAGVERGHSQIASRAMRTAIRTLLDSDFETAEGLLDTALASGWSAAAVARVRSLSRLAQGDVGAAIRVLQDARSSGAAPESRRRLHLAEALILMRCGQVEGAICTALDGLSACRRSGDRRGEQAALRVLAVGYRQLKRDADAERIEASAAAAG
jgi:hypothetical protein